MDSSRLSRRSLMHGVVTFSTLLAVQAVVSSCGGSAPPAPSASAGSGAQSTVATAGATSAPAGQASSSAQPVKIDFWLLGGAPQGKIITDSLFADYKKSHPTTSLSLQMMASWPDLYQKLLTSMAGGTPPNMSRIKDYWTPQFGTPGSLVTLDKYMSASSFDPKRYVPQRWASTQIQGKTYALPWTLFQENQFYNVDLLKQNGFTNADGSAKPPATWDERRAYAKKLTDTSKQQWGMMLYETDNLEGTTYDWLDLLLEAGGEFMNADRTKFLFNTPEGILPIQYYLDLLYTDKSAIPVGVSVPNGVNGGKVALWMSGPWTIPTMRTQAPKLPWAISLKPKLKNDAAALGGNNLTMYKDAKDQDATWDWLSYMAKPESDLTWNSKAGYMPVQPENWKKAPYTTDPAWKMVAAQAAEPNPTLPIVLNFQEILQGIAGELQSAYLQKKTPKQALQDAYDQSTKILERSTKK